MGSTHRHMPLPAAARAPLGRRKRGEASVFFKGELPSQNTKSRWQKKAPWLRGGMSGGREAAQTPLAPVLPPRPLLLAPGHFPAPPPALQVPISSSLHITLVKRSRQDGSVATEASSSRASRSATGAPAQGGSLAQSGDPCQRAVGPPPGRGVPHPTAVLWRTCVPLGRWLDLVNLGPSSVNTRHMLSRGLAAPRT